MCYNKHILIIYYIVLTQGGFDMENINNIYGSVAEWWTDKVREIYNNKVNENDMRVFKNYLTNLIDDNISLKGCLTISLTPHNILTKSLIHANIFSNILFKALKDEMKITPHLISLYDEYGHLQWYLSI